jgi:hypothetical protein
MYEKFFRIRPWGNAQIQVFFYQTKQSLKLGFTPTHLSHHLSGQPLTHSPNLALHIVVSQNQTSPKFRLNLVKSVFVLTNLEVIV